MSVQATIDESYLIEVCDTCGNHSARYGHCPLGHEGATVVQVVPVGRDHPRSPQEWARFVLAVVGDELRVQGTAITASALVRELVRRRLFDSG